MIGNILVQVHYISTRHADGLVLVLEHGVLTSPRDQLDNARQRPVKYHLICAHRENRVRREFKSPAGKNKYW